MMKYIITSTILMVSIVFADYSYKNNTSGKIDMHGGKSDKLTTKSSSFSKNSFSLGNMGLQKNIKKSSNKASKKTKSNTFIKD